MAFCSGFLLNSAEAALHDEVSPTGLIILIHIKYGDGPTGVRSVECNSVQVVHLCHTQTPLCTPRRSNSAIATGVKSEAAQQSAVMVFSNNSFSSS